MTPASFPLIILRTQREPHPSPGNLRKPGAQTSHLQTVLLMRASDVVSGCPWPRAINPTQLLMGFQTLCPGSWASVPRFVKSRLLFLPCFLVSHTCLRSPFWPGFWIVSLLVPATQISLSYRHEVLIWGKLGLQETQWWLTTHRRDIHDLQILTRVILLCFNHARVNYIFYSCNGYGGFSDVGWNDHFAIALKGGRKPKSHMTHIWFRSFKTYSLPLISTMQSWSRKDDFVIKDSC